MLAAGVNSLYNCLVWAILLRAILSWFRPQTYNRLYSQFSRLLYQITEPLLGPVRNFLPVGGMGIDFSPLIVVYLLGWIRNLLLRMLW